MMKSKRSLWVRELLLIYHHTSQQLTLATKLEPFVSMYFQFFFYRKKKPLLLTAQSFKNSFIAKTALRSGYLFQLKWILHYQLDRRLCKCETCIGSASLASSERTERLKDFFRLIDLCPFEKPSSKMHFNLLLNFALCLSYLSLLWH